MTNEEKQEFYSCNIQDFMKRFNNSEYSDPNEALNDSMHYIARYNLDPKSTKCDINELIFTVKNEILKLIARKQIKEGKDVLEGKNKNDKEMIKSFIANPLKTTSYYLSKKQDTFDNMKKPSNQSFYVTLLRQNASQLAIDLRKPIFTSNYRKFVERKSKSVDLVAELEAQLPYSYDPIGSLFKRQRLNFFEKVLKPSSKEYKGFVKMFNHHYKNPSSPLFGNDSVLKQYAYAYIKHKFPKLKDGELPTEKQLNTLSRRGKSRTGICIKIINLINEKEALADKMKLLDNKIKYSIDKYPWDNEANQDKSVLEMQLEKDAHNDIIPPVDDKNGNNNIINNEELNDEFINDFEIIDDNDLFK